MKKEKRLRSLRFQLILSVEYLVLSFIQFVGIYSASSFMIITHSTMTLACGVMTLCYQFLNCVRVSGVVQLCNGFIQLERNFSKSFENQEEFQKDQQSKLKNESKNFVLRGIVYLLTYTGMVATMVYCLDILRNPCFSTLVGYWMNGQCEDGKPGYYHEPTWSLVEVGTKVGLASVSYFIWSPLLISVYFYMSLEFVMEGHCFRVEIEEFGKKYNYKKLSLIFQVCNLIF